jgi:hypothetical protein
MTAKPFTIAAVALAAALSGCAASASSPQKYGSADHCGYDDGNSFNTPMAMKLPKDAFCSPK